MGLTRDRHDHKTGETSREHVFVITSLPADRVSPEQLADYIRGHWGIENLLHWVRDVTFDEDRSQVRTGNAAHVMASLRNLAISIHRLTGASNIAKALRNAMRNRTSPANSPDFEKTLPFHARSFRVKYSKRLNPTWHMPSSMVQTTAHGYNC